VKTKANKKEMAALLQRLVKAVGDCEDTEAVLAISKEAEVLLNAEQEEKVYPEIILHEFVWVRNSLNPTEERKGNGKVISFPCTKFEFQVVYGGKDRVLKGVIAK
jgi:hypothetical protein